MKQNIPIDNPVLPSDAFPSGKCWIWFGLSILLYLIINPISALVAVLICAIAIFWNVLLRNKFGLYHLLFVSSFFIISFLWNLLFTHSVPAAAYIACSDLGYYFVVFFAAFVYRFSYARKYDVGFSERDQKKILSFLIDQYKESGKTTYRLSDFAKSEERIAAARHIARIGYIVIADDIYQTVTITEAFIKEFVNAEPTENTQESPAEPSDPPTEQSDEEVKVTEPLEIKSTENSSDGDNNCIDTKKLTIITILLLSLIIFIVVLLSLPISRTNRTETPSERNQHRVTVSFELISNDHVGNDWKKQIYFRNIEIDNNTIITAIRDFHIGCYIRELDEGEDDVSYAGFVFTPGSNVGEKQTMSKRITTTEDAGQYAGNTAVWEVTVTVERLS